jgi:hypothetical protein
VRKVCGGISIPVCREMHERTAVISGLHCLKPQEIKSKMI